MAEVLVTGSSGLLGSYVATALDKAGFIVTGLDVIEPQQEFHWTHISGDATQLDILCQFAKGKDAIVHIAGIPRPTGSAAVDIYKTNMAATFSAAEAARICDVRRFVYASSFSVLGYPFFEVPIVPSCLPIDESHPEAPQDIYALTKWLGEELIESMVRRNAFSAVSLRMPWIQTPETFYKEAAIRRQSVEAARDLWAYIDARDAAAAFVGATRCSITGHHRFFISAKDTYSEIESAKLVESAYPQTDITKPFQGHETLINYKSAQKTLGFTPQHSWREYKEPVV